MATIEKRKTGSWRAKVRIKGFDPISRTFDTKRDAKSWAEKVEDAMRGGYWENPVAAPSTTLEALLKKYREEVAPTKKSPQKLISRLKQLERSPIAQREAAKLRGPDFSRYRNERLTKVSPYTVNNELIVFSRVYTVARREWGLDLGNPLEDVERPKKPAGRDERCPRRDERRLLRVARRRHPLMRLIIAWAIETGMRRGEIIKLRTRHVDTERRVALLLDVKNGKPRKVPLSTRALAIYRIAERDWAKGGRLFPFCMESVSQWFRRLADEAGLPHLRFHDLRHEAGSRFVEMGYDVREVAYILGHKTLNMVMTYTHPDGERLAQRLR